MERNGKIVCDECNLIIYPMQRSRSVAREPRAGHGASVAHYHARDSTDCFSRTLEKAKALTQTLAKVRTQ